MMRVGIAADHAGFRLKQELAESLRAAGHDVVDFGAQQEIEHDDYPDYVLPMAEAVGRGEVERGIAICGSGVGASIAANSLLGVRAAVCHDVYSAHQGVEHDAMNVLCLGSRVIGAEVARELIQAFLGARFSGKERHRRRLEKVVRDTAHHREVREVVEREARQSIESSPTS